jgi:predicted nuclease with TOPRIM domain
LTEISIVQKGRSAYLIKQSAKRKSRPNADQEEVKQVPSGSKSKSKIMEQNKRVREEIGSLKDQVDELQNYKHLVFQLHETGLIDNQGQP